MRGQVTVISRKRVAMASSAPVSYTHLVQRDYVLLLDVVGRGEDVMRQRTGFDGAVRRTVPLREAAPGATLVLTVDLSLIHISCSRKISRCINSWRSLPTRWPRTPPCGSLSAAGGASPADVYKRQVRRPDEYHQAGAGVLRENAELTVKCLPPRGKVAEAG